MSLHIFAAHTSIATKGIHDFSLDILEKFNQAFANDIIVFNLVFELEDQKLDRPRQWAFKPHNDLPLSKEKVQDYLEKIHQEIGKEDDRLISLKINGTFLGHLAVIRLNNSIECTLFGDVEIDIFRDPTIESSPDSFAQLIKTNSTLRGSLDVLFSEIKNNKLFKRAYVDELEEGEVDPLDRIYQFDTESDAFIKNLLKIVERSEEPEFMDLYEKIQGTDRDYLARKCWGNETFRNFIINCGKENQVAIAGGSIKVFAKNRKSLNAVYDECIRSLIKPLFDPFDPIETRIERQAKKL